jgi:hypothetical protein
MAMLSFRPGFRRSSSAASSWSARPRLRAA